ncbi:hypothetical protein E4U41_003648, partial [Claviceps citrina]
LELEPWPRRRPPAPHGRHAAPPGLGRRLGRLLLRRRGCQPPPLGAVRHAGRTPQARAVVRGGILRLGLSPAPPGRGCCGRGEGVVRPAAGRPL